MDFKELTKNLDEPTRRSFIMKMAGSFLGVSALSHTSTNKASAASGNLSKRNSSDPINVIYLYMNGGMSHIDTLDPKPGTSTQPRTSRA